MFLFAHNPKKFLEFQKLLNPINTKGNKILKNTMDFHVICNKMSTY